MLKNMLKASTLAVLIALSAPASAIGPNGEKQLQFDYVWPTTRTNASPLTQAEISQGTLYKNGAAIATVTPPSTSYTYTIASSTCVNTTDVFSMTVADKSTPVLISSAATASVTSQVCSPAAPPSAPTGLNIIVK